MSRGCATAGRGIRDRDFKRSGFSNIGGVDGGRDLSRAHKSCGARRSRPIHHRGADEVRASHRERESGAARDRAARRERGQRWHRVVDDELHDLRAYPVLNRQGRCLRPGGSRFCRHRNRAVCAREAAGSAVRLGAEVCRIGSSQSEAADLERRALVVGENDGFGFACTHRHSSIVDGQRRHSDRRSVVDQQGHVGPTTAVIEQNRGIDGAIVVEIAGHDSKRLVAHDERPGGIIDKGAIAFAQKYHQPVVTRILAAVARCPYVGLLQGNQQIGIAVTIHICAGYIARLSARSSLAQRTKQPTVSCGKRESAISVAQKNGNAPSVIVVA